MSKIFTLLFTLCLQPVAAGEIDFSDKIFDRLLFSYKYLAPNETHFRLAQRIYRSAPPGALVTVGTERGWMAASLNDNVTELIFRDSDNNIAIYNVINALLLKAARTGDREHFLRLRREAVKEEWIQAADESGLNEREKKTLLEVRERWDIIVNRNEFKDFHSPTGSFRGLNYLFDDELFARVQRLAKNNRVSVAIMNFNESEKVTQLVNDLKARGTPLSILDYSNAWWYNRWQSYTEPVAMAHMLNSFSQIASNESMLMLTSTNLPAIALTYLTDGVFSNHFSFGAYTFKNLRSYPTMDAFVKTIWLDWFGASFRTKVDSYPPTAGRCAQLLLSNARRGLLL